MKSSFRYGQEKLAEIINELMAEDKAQASDGLFPEEDTNKETTPLEPTPKPVSTTILRRAKREDYTDFYSK